MTASSPPAPARADKGRRPTPPTSSARPAIRRDILVFVLAGCVAAASAAAILLWNNPGEVGSHGYRLALNLRLVSVGTIGVVAACQAAGTVLFHTVTGNRILTPSIMGFEAIYVLMQTALVFFFGGAMLAATDGLLKVALQSLLMVGFTTILFTKLFASRRGNLHVMLLVGVVLGVGFASLATFMQRLLTPSDFDLLTARMFGNLSNSNPEYLPYAAVIVAALLGVVWVRRHRLDVLALGPDIATNLGLRYKREVTELLVIVSALMAVSTALVGPLAFLGFVIANLSYQLLGTTRHAKIIPFAILLAMATLFAGYFVLRHVFYAAGMLSVIIEFVGGVAFLWFLLRKGSL